MKISIAMTTYNGEMHLRDQLDSLLSQTRLPDELVICDDGSTDSTIDMLEHFKNVAPFNCVIIKNGCNQGTGISFKNAIDLCSGDIIAFCDQDDIWASHKIETVGDLFVRYPAVDFLLMNAAVIDERGEDLGYSLWDQRKFGADVQNLFCDADQFKVILSRNITTGMSTAVRANITNMGVLKPNNINHDAWYIPLASMMGSRGLLVQDKLVLYRQHSLQQFGSLRQDLFSRFQSSVENNLKIIGKNKNNLEALYNSIPLLERSLLDDKNISLLKAKINHFEARQNICIGTNFTALKACISEIINGNYIAYGSFKSIIFDFISRLRS